MMNVSAASFGDALHDVLAIIADPKAAEKALSELSAQIDSLNALKKQVEQIQIDAATQSAEVKRQQEFLSARQEAVTAAERDLGTKANDQRVAMEQWNDQVARDKADLQERESSLVRATDAAKRRDQELNARENAAIKAQAEADSRQEYLNTVIAANEATSKELAAKASSLAAAAAAAGA